MLLMERVSAISAGNRMELLAIKVLPLHNGGQLLLQFLLFIASAGILGYQCFLDFTAAIDKVILN